jgi:hypothetical protein
MGESAWLFPTSPIALYLRTTAYVMSSNCPMIPSLECWRRSIEIVCAAMLVSPLLGTTLREGGKEHITRRRFFCYRQRLVCGSTFVVSHPKPRPRFIEPMECKRVSKLPEGESWACFDRGGDSDDRVRSIPGRSNPPS